MHFESKPVESESVDVKYPRFGGRLPSVDGWRALSIMMVLAAHSSGKDGFSNVCGWALAHFRLLFDGNLGVRFFFVISGFLITYLLIQEQERNGRVSLKNLYQKGIAYSARLSGISGSGGGSPVFHSCASAADRLDRRSHLHG